MSQKTVSQKTVIQLSSGDESVYKSLISQIQNILNALEGIKLEIVTHGPGVDFLKQNNPFEEKQMALGEQGVQFFVCQNSLNAKKLDISYFSRVTEIVPSALAHIIVRQSEGWSYIKAGF